MKGLIGVIKTLLVIFIIVAIICLGATLAYWTIIIIIVGGFIIGSAKWLGSALGKAIKENNER